jgi:exonuclease SbcD
VAYQSPVPEDAGQEAIERNAFLDLLSAHRDYKKRADFLAQGLIDLKDRRLQGQADPELYDLVATLLDPDGT